MLKTKASKKTVSRKKKEEVVDGDEKLPNDESPMARQRVSNFQIQTPVVVLTRVREFTHSFSYKIVVAE